ALLIPILRARLLARSVESLRLLEGLYDSMRQVAGARVLVDASKSPAYALLLSNVPGIDLRVLHLVRDPRGAVFSWANPKFNPASGRPLVRLSGPRMVALWNTWNLGAELLGRSLPGPHRYARLRYEDFAEAPAAQLHRALRTLAMLGTGALPPFAGERRIFLTRGHTIGGNPGRFEEGVIEIRRDERWRDEASAAFRALVALGCAPLLKRYGYRFRRPPRADRGPSASAPGQIS
ncbi:MAG: hypothetical protein R3325_04990, partial [Thermoanaerobaculia bacterium]|nr:hypothetical protein [Thermoanaerobaculia bacterium]